MPEKAPHPDPELDDLESGRVDVLAPGYWEKLSRQLPAGMRKRFEPMIRQAKQHAAGSARIEAAAEMLEAHRGEYDALTKQPTELFRRAEDLFGEEPFKAMRFRSADVQRAFEAVGYPPADSMGKEFISVVDKAIRFLMDETQRASLARRLLDTLPDYVNAGRHLDGWIIQHSAYVVAEKASGVVGVFLLSMFMHGMRDWEKARDREREALFEEMGIGVDEIRHLGYAGIEARMRAAMERPDKSGALTKFLAKHPELEALSRAQCLATEKAAVALLEREDAEGLYLSPDEVEPWLEVFERRVREIPEIRAVTRQPDKAALEPLAKALYDVATEMAAAIFTPARLERLAAQIHEYRGGLSAENEKEFVIGIHGALAATHPGSAPADSRFLVSLCVTSLRAAMQAMA